MQFKMDFQRRSEEEYIKDQGLIIDYDEIARKGKMSKEESLISKWYGVYQSRQPGDFMARIVIPGGRVSSSQIRRVAEVSEKYSQGLVSITTRQALQLHRLQLKDLAGLMRDIKDYGITTFHGCGDVVRTVAACPLAETCKYSRIDVYPYAYETMKYLTSFRDLDNLPRKLKVNFSGCSAGCGQPYMNCIGINALSKNVEGKLENGFKVVIGGGMGWKAFVAQELFGFVPEDRILQVCRAIALLFRDYGDRYNRTTSRLKFVVSRNGIEKCREIVLQYLEEEKVSVEGIIKENIEDAGILVPKNPLSEADEIGTDGKAVVRIIVPKGEINSKQLLRIAELSEIYGNQRVYTDNRQNLSIKGVDNVHVKKLKQEIKDLGFETEGFFGLSDIVSCVGTTYCPKAVAATRTLFDMLLPIVKDEKYSSILTKGFINLTGCPNSCSPYRIADIGFRGERIREEEGSVEGFEVLVGGSQTQHGIKLGDFKLEDCPGVVKKLLDLYLEGNQEGETLSEFYKRIGIESIKENIYELSI